MRNAPHPPVHRVASQMSVAYGQAATRQQQMLGPKTGKANIVDTRSASGSRSAGRHGKYGALLVARGAHSKGRSCEAPSRTTGSHAFAGRQPSDIPTWLC